MAKSVRAKSVRKAKALKRAAIFKPVADERLRKITEKLHAGTVPMPGDVVMDCKATSLAGPDRFRNRKKLMAFSAYGLHSKEHKF